MNLIEQLKDPKQAQPYGLYRTHCPEKAEVLKKAGWKNRLVLEEGCFTPDYDNIGPADARSNLHRNQFTFILKPDYKPEPEYVDKEIYIKKEAHVEWLGIYKTNYRQDVLPHTFTHLHCLSSLPGFVCFWLDEGDGYHDGNSYVGPARIAGLIEEGRKIYARFRAKKQE